VRREALVWNTRLRMDRGVGVVGNGMGSGKRKKCEAGLCLDDCFKTYHIY
jgi:hypothetical protein